MLLERREPDARLVEVSGAIVHARHQMIMKVEHLERIAV
jgi:hypothetical protein